MYPGSGSGSGSEGESETDDGSSVFYEQHYLVRNNRYSDSDNDSSSESNDELIIDDVYLDSDDDDYDEDYNEIYQNDSEHMYSEKQHGQYYIGISKYIRRYDTILLVNSVSTNAFLRYSFNRIYSYLSKYSIVHMQNARVHIMKLDILQDGTYSVILKTHWLRLIQRHWKKVFKERTLIIKKRCSIKNLLSREIHGHYVVGLNSMPNINGILNCYSK
jgi:hypothetical protein